MYALIDTVLDTATMGASLSRSMFIQTQATDAAVRNAVENEKFDDMRNQILKQENSKASNSFTNETTTYYAYETTTIRRLGEFTSVRLCYRW